MNFEIRKIRPNFGFEFRDAAKLKENVAEYENFAKIRKRIFSQPPVLSCILSFPHVLLVLRLLAPVLSCV